MNTETENRTPLASLQKISKVFFTEDLETHALSEIDLDIHDGEFLSISGPSGCGKSTLLSILGLLDTPTEGEYTLGERPVANLSLSERALNPKSGDRVHLSELQLGDSP